MSTSGGEPRTLLNALRPMLGSLGDIRTPQEVVRVISLMRDAEKLMSRCIYLNILKATISAAKENRTSSETLEKFMSIGGWSILNKWLLEAKKNENFPVLVELLEVLRDLPVSIDTLKQGNTGKVIKHLTKLENQDVKKLASGIVKQWMSLVRNQSGISEKVEKSKQNGSEDVDDSLQGSKKAEGKPAKRIRDNNASDSNRSPQPEKKSKTLNEVKSDIKQSMSQKNVSKTKVIPPQPKPVAMESAGFMNALTSAASAAPVRKRKRVTTVAKTETTTTSTTVTSSTSTTKPTFTGILDAILDSQSQTHGQEDGREKDTKEKDSDNSNNSNNKSGSTPNGSPENSPAIPSGDIGDFTKGSDPSEKDSSNSVPQASSDTTASVGDENTEDRPAKKSKKGKKVQWPADDSNLATFHYFEMDEDERALVRHPVNFLDAAHNDMVRERQLVEQAKRLHNEDTMAEKIKWYRPVAIMADHHLERGGKSEQKHIQKTREASILADIFFTKSSLPDSAAEPEPENQQGNPEEPKVIPHDEKGTTHVPAKAAVLPTNTSGVQLPPAIMSLFSSAASNQVAAGSQGPQVRPPVTVQTLLDKFMKPSQPGGQSSVTPNSQPLLQNESGGSSLPDALKQILEPLQQNKMGPPRMQVPGMGPGMGPGTGLLGAAPGDPAGMLNAFRPPGPMGPRGVQGPHMRPDMLPHFQGPGGPRQGPPIGPLFPGPEGPMMGPRMRGFMPPRMQGGPGVGRGMMSGPRPLLPEMANRDDFPPEQFDDGGEYGDEDEEGEIGDNMGIRGRGRGMSRGRARGRGRGRGTPPICRHFVSKRGCLRGATCHFLHPGVNGPPV